MSDMKISVSIDIRELLKGVDLTKDQLNKLNKTEIEIKTDKAQSSIADLRGAIAEWTLALTGVMKVAKTVVSAMSNVANAAIFQQKAAADLGSALRNTGVYSVELENALRSQAGAIQEVTTASDDDIIMMTRQMQIIGKLSGDQLPAAQKAAVGLAKAYQIDLKTAFELVGKAAAGNTSVLGRYGIVLDASMTQAEKFDEVLRRGTEGFAMAEAETATTAGAVEQLKNAWGDLQEDIGEMIILPILDKVSRVLKDIVLGANSVINTLTGMPGSVDRITKAANEQRIEFERLVIIYARLRENQSRSDEQNREYKKTIDDLNSNYPNYLNNVNLEADSWNDVTAALDRARKMLMDVVRSRIQEAVFKDMEDQIVAHATKTVKLQAELDTLQAEFAAGTKNRTQMIQSTNRQMVNETSVMATDLQEIQTGAGQREAYLIAQIGKRKEKEDDLTEALRRRMEVAERIYAIQPKDENKPQGSDSLDIAGDAEIEATASAYDKLLDELSKYYSERELRSYSAHQREMARLASQLDDEQHIVLSALADNEITEEEAQVSLLSLRDKYNDLMRVAQIAADAELVKLAEDRTNKLLSDESAYYEAVKFADESYYNWKMKKIQAEVDGLTISDEQKVELIKKLMTELDALKSEYDYSEPAKKGSWFFSGLLGFDPDSEEDMAKVETIKGVYSDMMAQASQAITGFMRLSNQRRDEDLANLETRAAAERMTNEQMLSEKEKISEYYVNEERRLKRIQKAMSIAQATVNVAEGVTKALTLGPIIGPILASIITAMGATQIGIISAQKFASGGIFKGQGGPRDDANLAYISDGEYIVNAAATKQFKPILDAINFGRSMPVLPRLGYANGGQFESRGLLSKIDTIITKIEILNMNLVKKEFNAVTSTSGRIQDTVRAIDRTRTSMEKAGYVQGNA